MWVNKVRRIKDFTDELHTTFSNIKHLQGLKNKYLEKLTKIGMPYFIYPFLIKGMKYFKDDTDKLDQLFKIMKVLCFGTLEFNCITLYRNRNIGFAIDSCITVFHSPTNIYLVSMLQAKRRGDIQNVSI